MSKLDFNTNFMETQIRPKKVLKSLLNEALREALGGLQLPGPSKKIKKILSQSSKKLATAYSDLIVKEEKRRKKAEKLLNSAVNGHPKRKKKKVISEKIAEPANG